MKKINYLSVCLLTGVFVQPVSAALYFTTLNNLDGTAHGFFSNQGSSSARSEGYVQGSTPNGTAYGIASAQAKSIVLHLAQISIMA